MRTVAAMVCGAFLTVVPFCGTALAQAALLPAATGGCTEIIPARAGNQPAILLDRCTGQTWQLVRSSARRHSAYVWRPLLKEDTAPRTVAATPAPVRPVAPAATPRGKCFTFDGRTFCE